VEDTITSTEATARAIRLLDLAENETDRQLMEGLTRLAEGWVAVAGLLREAE
jgi:hypothetical protein